MLFLTETEILLHRVTIYFLNEVLILKMAFLHLREEIYILICDKKNYEL